MRFNRAMIPVLFRGIVVCCIAAGVCFLPLLAESDSVQSGAKAVDAAKKRSARIKRFLQRAIDELDQSLFFAREDIADIQRQIDAISFAGRTRADEELRSLIDWHYDYESALQRYHAAFEQDLNVYYAGTSDAKGWTGRYEAMHERLLQMKTDLAARVRRLEEERGRVEDNILLRRLKLLRLREPDWDDELRLKREKRKQEKRALQEEEERLIVQLEAEIRAFEHLVLQYNTLIEKHRGAQDWLSLKVADYETLNEVARAIGAQDQAAAESAYHAVIRTFDADIAFLTRRIEDYDRKRSQLTRSGALSTLDRQEEQSSYYERQKSRYERQVNWLRVQIGNYRAELVDIWSDGEGKRTP